MFVQMFLQHKNRPGVCCATGQHNPGNVPHLRVIVSHAFDTFSQVDCVSGGIYGKLMGSHEQWLRTVFLLLAARTWTNTEPPNVTGEETVYGPTGDSNRKVYKSVFAICDGNLYK